MADQGVVASARQRLVNASKSLGMPNEIMMRRYAFERLLARMAASDHAEQFCLKGAMAFVAVTGDFARPTRDMDFTGRKPMAAAEALRIWRSIAGQVPPEDDGLTFLPETFKAEEIRAGSEEPGTRILGECRLGNARIPLKIEVSYGHALTPGAVLLDYPTILDGSKPARVLCYSKETIMAEKFEAVCSLGERTSRFKDFYDIRGLARSVPFDANLLADAFRNTFERRETPLPEVDPVVFLPDFHDAGQRGWTAFLKKQGVTDPQTFADLLAEIQPLVMGTAALARGEASPGRWTPETGWSPTPADDDKPALEDEEDRSFTPF